jgi:hypothetical protein
MKTEIPQAILMIIEEKQRQNHKQTLEAQLLQVIHMMKDETIQV